MAIGPVNNAGQAHAWADAVRRFTDADAMSFAHAAPPGRPPTLSFPADRRLPHPRLTPAPVKALLLNRLLQGVTHLAVDSFASLYARLDRSHIGIELTRLTRTRPDLALALIAHGSDLRDPDRHGDRLRHSYYRTADRAWVDHLRRVSTRNRMTAHDSGLPLFVSTPDLLLEDVAAVWLPVVVDPAAWLGAPAPMQREVPVVVHLPSRRNPPIKGTDVIDPVLRDLHDAGRVRYVSPSSLPHAAVPALVRDCDILVEQVRSGYYGVNAVEGLAAGRVVVSSLAPDVAAVMPQIPPFAQADPDTFAEVMEGLLQHRSDAAQMASRGPAFVADLHDGRASAAALSPWLGATAI